MQKPVRLESLVLLCVSGRQAREALLLLHLLLFLLFLLLLLLLPGELRWPRCAGRAGRRRKGQAGSEAGAGCSPEDSARIKGLFGYLLLCVSARVPVNTDNGEVDVKVLPSIPPSFSPRPPPSSSSVPGGNARLCQDPASRK